MLLPLQRSSAVKENNELRNAYNHFTVQAKKCIDPLCRQASDYHDSTLGFQTGITCIISGLTSIKSTFRVVTCFAQLRSQVSPSHQDRRTFRPVVRGLMGFRVSVWTQHWLQRIGEVNSSQNSYCPRQLSHLTALPMQQFSSLVKDFRWLEGSIETPT